MKSNYLPIRIRGTSCAMLIGLFELTSCALLASAILVQPHNPMLDDSALTNQHDNSGSLSPFYNDAVGNEQQQDKDIVSIIGESLARLRFARMLDQQREEAGEQTAPAGQLSAEMAELLQSEQQANKQEQEASLGSSMASMLMNVAQVAAAQQQQQQQQAEEQQQSDSPQGQMSARGSIMELDTSNQAGASASSQASKSDLKVGGPSQWFNPKETIPVLKISSMATPSKYKKVYFRSEKKLVDGAFHSPSGSESTETKKSSLVKSPFGHSAATNVQRRSSRGSTASAPPSVLQDGVIDFLKKFRDVYVQTRPAGSPTSGAGAASSNPFNFASSVVSAAASSPLASLLAPPSGSSRPNLMGALSTASQMVNSAAMLSQAAASNTANSQPGSSNSPASSAASGVAGAAAANGSKSPLSTQNYVSFWSKTFPTWVRKMLKQMRRRSLYNSSKRQQQQQHHHHAATGIGQKVSNGAVSSIVESSSGSSSNGNSNTSSSAA